jgi:thiamine-phosphate pyrophosphorylase
MSTLPPGLYAIADAAFGDPVKRAGQLAAAGCKTIQLRAKGRSEADVLQLARAVQPTMAAHGVFWIINDHPQVAVEVGASGVHLGQADLHPGLAREIVGPALVIGWSTHTLAQVTEDHGADYIGFGPVFDTATKEGGYASRGTAMLRDAVRRSSVPVVAIGGIGPQNLAEVISTDVHGWAVVSALYRGGDIPDAVGALRAPLFLR